MFKNYLLLSLKVLKRKPFYTFISLFGISFTLMILMLVTSMGNAMLGSNKPMTDMHRMVFMPTVERFTPFYDTLTVVDSIVMTSGEMRYDTTYETNERGRMVTNGPGSFHFLDNNLRDLEDVESYSFINSNNHADTYLDGRKVSMSTYYVDADYFRVFDFNFLYGLPFGQAAIDEASKVIVMTDKAAKNYFGEASAAVIDREVEIGREKFRVVGIVARPLVENEATGGDVLLPYTTIDNKELASTTLGGGFLAVFKAVSPEKRTSVIDQLAFYADNFSMPPDQDFEKLGLDASTYLELFADRMVPGDSQNTDPSVWTVFGPIAVLLVLFLVLPLINLINLNISRVFERKSEIAVRKAFGADSKNILYQFVLENLVITFIGGLIGLILAFLIIQYVNANDLLGITRLAFSFKVFLYFLIVILLFGLVSGILPAYRMSRTNIGEALR
ncbi:ABC transporter permease [Neolewinella antarctica]|uniref:ABC transport system permease protein n=1 Tax=Neolewinella antarctica TaxID=442734 RepID=A0ABX0X9Z2_9BACT|nr:FtsX-like permease family protein [Neolewinella antarctica]NJC26063.1 putative ABC transport system permease protein [Neolewinella antarctica]